MTLQRDCVAQSPIVIPAGKTLDGDGHTVFLLGSSAVLPFGIGADGVAASVTNLTIDGSGVTGTCAQRGVGIQFTNVSGTIRDTAITGLSQACGFGISVIVSGGASPERAVDIDNVEISDAEAGIVTSGINKLTLGVSECDIQDVRFGIQVQYTVEATIDSNEIEANTYGVAALATAAVAAAPVVTATGNTVTGAQIGMSVALADADTSPVIPTLTAAGNTIVGPGPIAAGATHGLFFGKQAAGSANANTISNYFDNRADVGCGVFVAANAGAVTVGANTFPNPQGSAPGNELNVCEN